jgi:enoyl-CoA hydratase/carnithine racemase
MRHCPQPVLAAAALDWARQLARGPRFASGITKTVRHQEWNMGIDQAIEAEAQAQVLSMLTEDFGRAYRAFVAKDGPAFEVN